MVDPVLSRERVEQLRDIGVLTSMFFEAAETERRLPAVVRKQTRAAWPDYPDEADAYGWTDEEVRLGPASAKAIEDYNLALNLTFLMGEQDRKLVWNFVAEDGCRGANGSTSVRVRDPSLVATNWPHGHDRCSQQR